MTVRFATPDEIANWDKHILANPDGGNIFASFEFAIQKETGGYKAYFLFVGKLAITALEKRSPIGRFWYLPKGPGVTTTKELLDILKALKPFVNELGVFGIRIESELPRSSEPTLTRHGMVKSPSIIPNPSTITLDISKPLEQVLSELPQKGRHAIKRAQRDGVTTELVPASKKNCLVMYKLLQETADGQFGVRGYDYFESFWQRFEKADLGQLFFAYFEGKIVAGAYAMTFGKKSTYKDGASVRKRTVYGASHLLQWRVIEWAKSRGVTLHDFMGSPPSDEINNPDHKHYGVGMFKTAFNKEVTDYIGCYDFIIDSWAYKVWSTVAERVMRRLHYFKHHDSYY